MGHRGLPLYEPLVVYLHGVPGSSAELHLIGAVDRPTNILAPDRFAVAYDPNSDLAFDQLAREIAEKHPTRQFTLVGFSLGSFVALQLARRLGARVDSINLISATAPLESGDFLDSMAGEAVFRTARRSPRLFGLMATAQAILARATPGVLFSALFRNAAGADRALAKDPAFRSIVEAMLQTSLGRDTAQYRREIGAYVQPWADLLPEIRVRTTLWHGDEDNWSPFAMALALKDALPNARLIPLPGCSHYSAVIHSFPEIASTRLSACLS